jgi:hypothetical protein
VTRAEIHHYLDCYYVTANADFLDKIIASVQGEKREPSVQETILCLDKMTEHELTRLMEQQSYARISVEECTNYRLIDGKLVQNKDCKFEEGKLIRVYPADLDPEKNIGHCVLMQLASYLPMNAMILCFPPQGVLGEPTDA